MRRQHHFPAPAAGATGLAIALAALLPLLLPSPADAQMPDARQMSGMPLPVADAEPGSVTVRVVRGSLTNPLAGEVVELTGEASASARTNDTGRAEFTGLRAGARVRAVASIDGERLESQEFSVPSAGGIRVMLTASDPEDRALAQAPAEPGSVVLGEQSRFVFELGEDGLSVFYILDLVNGARTPVEPETPIVFELPADAEHAAVLQGSSPQAVVEGRRVRVNGPFAPGSTMVQFAYSLHYSGRSVTIDQQLPVAMTQLTVLAQKVGDMHLASPQMARHRDMASDGQVYILGQGPALAAGDTVSFTLTGLPGDPAWPKTLALALAVIVLLGGAWASIRTSNAAGREDARLKRLAARRESLLGELTTLEARHRDGTVDRRRYDARRGDLVAALEQIYAELDEEAAA